MQARIKEKQEVAKGTLLVTLQATGLGVAQHAPKQTADLMWLACSAVFMREGHRTNV
jgi:hypothetical protein